MIKSLSITFQTFAIFLRSLFLLCLFVCCLLLFKTLEALIRANSSVIFVFSIFTVFFSSEYMFIHKPTCLSITFQTFAIFLRSLFLLCLFVCCLLLFKTLEALIRANSSVIFVFSIFTVFFSSEYMFIHKPTFTALRVVFLSIKIIPVYKVIRIQIPLQNQQ